MTKTKTTTPPTSTGNGRKALHAYVSDDAHEQWHGTCAAHGISASALLEALAPELADMLATDDVLVKAARKVDADRRRKDRRS